MAHGYIPEANDSRWGDYFSEVATYESQQLTVLSGEAFWGFRSAAGAYFYLAMKPITKPVVHRGPSEIQRIGNQAVQEAQEDLRAKGIPLCFSRNGRIYYEMPDGSIQTENPYPAMLRARGLPGGKA